MHLLICWTAMRYLNRSDRSGAWLRVCCAFERKEPLGGRIDNRIIGIYYPLLIHLFLYYQEVS